MPLPMVFNFSHWLTISRLSSLRLIASGTPLVGFATGGIPEMVGQDRTGYLVLQRDVNALVQSLQHAFPSDRLSD
jgi:glycosyltransferase involved in cell wall biosynthesis